MEKSKLGDYSVMKALGILLVVLGHATRMYTNDGIITPLVGSKVLNYLTLYIYNFHMPLFIFVSGAIYFYVKQELGKYREFKPFIKNKAKRLLIPYLVFGILYVAPVMLLLKLTKDNALNYIVKGILLSLNARHMWYVLALFIIFIIFFIVEKYINKIPAIVNILILLCIYIISVKLPAVFQISAVAHYFIFFYLGYLFEDYKNIIQKINRYFLAFILMFIANGLLLGISIYTNKYDTFTMKILNDLLYLLASICGIYYMYFISLIISKTKIVKSTIYKWLDKDGFGIYLFHPMIIYTIFYLFRRNAINPFLLAFSSFIIALILSDLGVKLIRKLHLQIIIGEKYKPRSISVGKNENIKG